MSKASITYLGGIDDVQRRVNLTGSQTIFSLDIGKSKNPKVVIDAGAIQGVKKAQELNKNVKKEVLGADFLVITHAHSDHAGMVPYLIKKGFSGRIIMTELTKLQCKEMWLDYVRLVKNEIEKVKELNAKIGKSLHDALQIIEHTNIIKSSQTKSKKFKSSESYLAQILGEKNIDEAYNESMALLKEFGVESESDISSVLNEVPELLFDEEDIEFVYGKIETLELKEEMELQNFHPISSGNDKTILKLPEMVKNGFNKTIPVASYMKGTVTSKLQSLVKKISKEIQENKQIQQENEELSNKVKLALNLVKWYEEKGTMISDFEKEHGSLLSFNHDELLAQIEDLRIYNFKGKTYDINDLIENYHGFLFKLPKSHAEYTSLGTELKSLGISEEKDIDKHLPELPDRDYENRDVKIALKSVYNTESTHVNISDYAVFIHDIYQFSPQEILGFFREQKRVYLHNDISSKLLEKLHGYVLNNAENLKRNSELRQSLLDAYDLVDIYEGNRELYLKNNKIEYQKAKKYVSSFKKSFVSESKYSKEDLDYILDVNYEIIANDKTIIHIRRLDDSRLYDVLFNENSNIVYYYEPKIRSRVKEKLSDQIQKLEVEKDKELARIQAYQDYLHFISIYEGKGTHNISSQEYSKAKSFLKKHAIGSKSDIENFNFFETDFPYALKDIENYFASVNFVSENFSLSDVDLIHIAHIDDERIYDIPYNYDKSENIFVIQEGLKDEIRKKLLAGIDDFFRISTLRKKKRNELLEKLKLYNFYTENYTYLFEIEGYENATDFLNALLGRNYEIRTINEKVSKIKLAKNLREKLGEGDSQREKDYREAKSFLDTIDVKDFDDLSKILKTEHYIPYSIEDIKKAISLLKSVHIDKNQDILESIKLNFFDAGHIEGSIQAVLTLVVSEVDNILNGGVNKKEVNTYGKRRLKHVNYGFSGDLGRIKDPNLSGSPELSPFKLDYYQVETTYAGRIHIDKEVSISRLVSSIKSARGKIVIPAFSMQRTQEILMILLEEMLESQKYIEAIRENVRKKKDKEKELSQIPKKATTTELLAKKAILEEEIDHLDTQISYFKSKVFDFNIVLDSPLSEKITEIYIDKLGSKYNLLDKKVQKKLFGKEVITYVKKTGVNAEKEENDERINLSDLYSDERRDKKEIIISASGMGDGGAIIPHLKENIQNPNSKIIWVGYCPPNTRGGKIKAGDEFISIDGEVFELKCEVDDIPGFSGHIDEEELIMLLSQQEFSKGAIIALTHGDEKRFGLAEKIQDEMENIGKKVKIIVPKLGDVTIMKI